MLINPEGRATIIVKCISIVEVESKKDKLYNYDSDSFRKGDVEIPAGTKYDALVLEYGYRTVVKRQLKNTTKKLTLGDYMGKEDNRKPVYYLLRYLNSPLSEPFATDDLDLEDLCLEDFEDDTPSEDIVDTYLQDICDELQKMKGLKLSIKTHPSSFTNDDGEVIRFTSLDWSDFTVNQ